MSYLQVIPADGKTDERRYEEFMAYMQEEGVIESALEEDYEGKYKGIIQEKIAADLSVIGLVFDDQENKELSVSRYRAMAIRNAINEEMRTLCEQLDNSIKYDLSEEDKAKIKELELKDDEIEDDIYVRPFCLYEVDIANMYKKDVGSLPEDPKTFAKLALEHEMDCVYEHSEDEDEDEDWVYDDDDEDDEEEEEDDDEDDEDADAAAATAGLSSSSKGKAAATAAEDKEDDDEEEDEAHVHGENCDHSHGAFDLDETDLPFEDHEVSVSDADTGLSLLKDHKAEVVALLEKITGNKVESFKSYHFPGRYYVVAWLKGFGIYGIRISYPMIVDDSDDEDFESDDEDDEE
ncbi:hypothetical protein LPJ64_000317 [Coemansia asiatica]|uniref:Uncharacterized protein n=1 Tax=Coemansia asiatica TaxID=1052880 RepID=A0A9W7XR30_9FUNG|nr:hypothetical protein LPJ64_000317 [Coemansia asiatica]